MKIKPRIGQTQIALIIISFIVLISCNNRNKMIESPSFQTLRPLMTFTSYEEDHVFFKRYEINNIYYSDGDMKMFSIVSSTAARDDLDTNITLSQEQMIEIKNYVNQVIKQEITQKYNTGVAGETNTIKVEAFFPREKYELVRYGRSFSLLMELGIIKGENLN